MMERRVENFIIGILLALLSPAFGSCLQAVW